MRSGCDYIALCAGVFQSGAIMGSVAENKAYYQTFDWACSTQAWSAPWGGARAMWCTSLYPRLRDYLPAARILEIGAGHGRIGRLLYPYATRELVLVDIMPDCVHACQRAFQSRPTVRCLQGDGESLRGVADNSVDLAISFYSLVGADAHTLNAYTCELQRVLSPNGVAFLHHSNAGYYYQAAIAHSDQRMSLLASYRDISVNATVMRTLADKHDLLCIRQECINWDMHKVLSDCFTTLARPGSHWAQPAQYQENFGFRDERKWAARRGTRAARYNLSTGVCNGSKNS